MNQDINVLPTTEDSRALFLEKVHKPYLELLKVLKENGFQFSIIIEHDAADDTRYAVGANSINTKYASPGLYVSASIYEEFRNQPGGTDFPSPEVAAIINSTKEEN